MFRTTLALASVLLFVSACAEESPYPDNTPGVHADGRHVASVMCQKLAWTVDTGAGTIACEDRYGDSMASSEIPAAVTCEWECFCRQEIRVVVQFSVDADPFALSFVQRRDCGASDDAWSTVETMTFPE